MYNDRWLLLAAGAGCLATTSAKLRGFVVLAKTVDDFSSAGVLSNETPPNSGLYVVFVDVAELVVFDAIVCVVDLYLTN